MESFRKMPPQTGAARAVATRYASTGQTPPTSDKDGADELTFPLPPTSIKPGQPPLTLTEAQGSGDGQKAAAKPVIRSVVDLPVQLGASPTQESKRPDYTERSTPDFDSKSSVHNLTSAILDPLPSLNRLQDILPPLPKSPSILVKERFEKIKTELTALLENPLIDDIAEHVAREHRPIITIREAKAIAKAHEARSFLLVLREGNKSYFEADNYCHWDKALSKLEASFLASATFVHKEMALFDLTVASDHQGHDRELDVNFTQDVAMKLHSEVVNSNFSEEVNKRLKDKSGFIDEFVRATIRDHLHSGKTLNLVEIREHAEKEIKDIVREEVALEVLDCMSRGRQVKAEGGKLVVVHSLWGKPAGEDASTMSEEDRLFAQMCSGVLREKMQFGVDFSVAVNMTIDLNKQHNRSVSRKSAQTSVLKTSMKEVLEEMRQGLCTMPEPSRIQYDGGGEPVPQSVLQVSPPKRYDAELD